MERRDIFSPSNRRGGTIRGRSEPRRATQLLLSHGLSQPAAGARQCLRNGEGRWRRSLLSWENLTVLAIERAVVDPLFYCSRTGRRTDRLLVGQPCTPAVWPSDPYLIL